MDTNTKAATTNAQTTGKKAGRIFSAICIAIMISIHTFQFFRAIQTERPTRMEQQRLFNQVLEDQKKTDPFDQLSERPAIHFDRNFGNLIRSSAFARSGIAEWPDRTNRRSGNAAAECHHRVYPTSEERDLSSMTAREASSE